MTETQVAGLLANQHQVLFHICIAGMKGRDYSKVKEWYELMNEHASHLVFLMQSEADQVDFLLDIVKFGLFSKNEEVAVKCCQLMTSIVSILNGNQHSESIVEIKVSFFEWLTVQRAVQAPQPVSKIA